MQTFTGQQFWPIDPRVEEIHIEDIAHALSNQCRYAGHCKSFYSVAQHSVLVSHVCLSEDALWGLMHDAAEAYLVDLPRPIKRHSALGIEYQAVEWRLMDTICKRFHLPVLEPKSVKLADDTLLVTEMRDLMGVPPEVWLEAKTTSPLLMTIRPISPEAAEKDFLDRFADLTQ